MKRWVLAVICLTAVTACTRRVPAPSAKPTTSGEPVDAWARVLQTHVNDEGQIDFVAVEKDLADLETYVAWASVNGPASTPAAFPTKEAKLAFYLNSYNAWCMYSAIKNDVKPKQKARFFALTKIMVDGQETTLYDLENKVVRPMGDPRIHFILNCMVKGCPRLPREPMRAETLEAQLDTAAKLFFGEERNVAVQDDRKVVRMSSICCKFYDEDFVAPKTDCKTLIDYANRYREKKIPADYKVEAIPYDWTLNQMPRAAGVGSL